MSQAMLFFKCEGIGVSKEVEFAHITLLYFGEVETLAQKTKLIHLLRKTAFDLGKNNIYSIPCKINGKVTFMNLNSPPVFALLVDGSLFPRLRVMIEDNMKFFDIPTVSEHGFVPHISLKYGEPHPDEDSHIGKTFNFDTLYLIIGEEVFDKRI